MPADAGREPPADQDRGWRAAEALLIDTAIRAGLVEVAGALPTFASPGLERRAAEVLEIAASSYDYLARLLDHRPSIQVVVLSDADWPSKGRSPLFGLPNAEAGTLVVAGTEAPWWSDLGSMAGGAGQAEIDLVYRRVDGQIHLGDFFDLVAVHEVAHLFAENARSFPRLWLGELFANLCLHAWVAERRPGALPTLFTLPRLASLAPAGSFEHRTRAEFEDAYTEMSGPNYVWYQFRLQVEAADLYSVAGEPSVRRLFAAFPLDSSVQDAGPGQWHDANLTDQALADRLGEAVHEQLGAFSLAF